MFRNKSRRGVFTPPQTQLDRIVGSIQNKLNDAGTGFSSKAVAGYALSMEGISDTEYVAVEQSLNGLHAALESVISENFRAIDKDGKKAKSPYTAAQIASATAIGIVASDIPRFLSGDTNVSMESYHDEVNKFKFEFVDSTGVSGAMTNRKIEGKLALEAYDEKENKNAVTYSVAYNLQAARQDEFGEAFFPTVVVTPDQVGFTVSIRLIQVYDDVRRQITGALDQFNKRNIIQAVIDPTILRNDQTKIYPVYRNNSTANFVDADLLAPITVVTDEGESITTSALKMGASFSLLGISQPDSLLATGLNDTSDSIDTDIKLQNLYLTVANGTEEEPDAVSVIKLNTANLPLTVFTYSVQNNYRVMNLAFSTQVLPISSSTRDVTGAAIASLAGITSGNYFVRLGTNVSGSVNLELADTLLYNSGVSVASVTDQDGNILDLTTGPGLTIANLFTGAAIIGYDLEARRTNLNRRQRGQLLDTTFYNQCYAVPLLSPITVPRPMTQGDANDSSDLAALITATHIRTSNAAVDELLRLGDILSEYFNSADYTPSATGAPMILGVARYLVQPFYEYQAIDVASQIDSLRSSQRAEDIQQLLINQIRDTTYRMYRDTGYKAAADALAGGVAQTPTVIVGTDIVLSRWLMVTGDFRTIGGEFNVKLVTTLNNRMKGKIVISFGQFGEGLEGVPNPMHFGNMAWKPELTLVLPLHRNGANSKELTVQPSFRHIINLPIMAVFDVTGIPEIAAHKVPIEFLTVESLP